MILRIWVLWWTLAILLWQIRCFAYNEDHGDSLESTFKNVVSDPLEVLSILTAQTACYGPKK